MDTVHSFQGVLIWNVVVQLSIPVVFPACPVTVGEGFTSIAAAKIPPKMTQISKKTGIQCIRIGINGEVNSCIFVDQI